LQSTQRDDLGVFSQIVTRGTHQIANILDEQQIDRGEIPIGERAFDHAAVEVTASSCRDLLDGETETGEPHTEIGVLCDIVRIPAADFP